MKLINPTDDELDAAFSEKVAGIKCLPASSSCTDCVVIPETGEIIKKAQQFTHSADAVLPWLEKHSQNTYDNHGGEPEVFRIYSPAGSHDIWAIEKVWMHHDGDIEEEITRDKSLPRACVIALLRAHGVEIEFIQ